MKILLVEDDDGHATLMHIYLKNSGLNHDLVRFVDGEDVLRFMAENDWKLDSKCVLLLDLRMPKIDGFEVLEAINRNCQNYKMPIFIITTSSNPDDKINCELLGCTKFFLKGKDEPEMIQMLTELCN